MGVVVVVLDRRTGKAEQRGSLQRRAHVGAQLALLRAVCLVGHHDHVRSLLGNVLGHALEQMHRGQDHAPVIAAELFFQIAFAGRHVNVVRAGGVELAIHLVAQLLAVHQQDDGRLLQLGVFPQAAGGVDHREGLA